MVDTIKFSQMTSGGDLANNETTPGLKSGANVLFNNPWTFLAPGTTAQRPAPSAAINYRLRFNTDDQLYEYYNAILGVWSQLEETAVTQGPFVTYKADATLPDAQNLGLLADGILIQTIAAGIATLDILAIPLTGTYGGTGVNNGISTITIEGNIEFSGAFPFIGNLTGATDVIFPTSGTLATTTGASGHVSTGNINELTWYAATGDTVSGLTTGNNGVLITSGAGVPSISSTLPTAVQSNITQLGAQSQALNMNSHLINNVSVPVSDSDAANKLYVDTTALNGTSVYAASAGSLGTVTQSGAGVGATLTNAGVQATFALDGANPPVGVNVLIKNTATGMTSANEGIYTVTSVGSGATNWVLTRATSYDTATEINQTGLILVQNGSTLVGTAWYNAATIVTVDTTAFSYSQFGNIVFPVSLANGGTSASLVAVNGGVVYSTATAMAISAAGLTGQVFQSNGAAPPTWSTPTYPSASGSAGKIMISDGTNNIYSTPLWPITGGTSGSVVISDGTNKINSTSLWPNTVGTAGKLMRSDGTVNAYSTFTIPDTFAINTIPYASSANVLGVIAAVNSAVMVSSAGGVPSFSTTLPANIAMTTPLISGSIKDANGNIILSFNPSATAVNYFQIQNAAAGNLPSLSLIGSDTNITGNLFSKGTGGFNIYGCSNASNSPAGAVGEIISSTVLAASPVSLTSTVNVDITSISLTAGDWDVYGNISYNPPGVASVCFGWANTSSATTPDLALTNNVVTGVVVNRWGFNIPFLRVNASGAQTVYLTASATFASGSAAAYGSIFARRRR